MSAAAMDRALKVASIVGKVAWGLILAWAGIAFLFGVLVPWGKEQVRKTYAYGIEKSGTFGCRDQSDMDRLVELSVVQKDVAAADRHLNALVQLMRCRYFPVGTQLVIEDRSGWKSLYRARAKGDPQAYWIPKEFVAKREVTKTTVSSRS